ncbi:MAG: hypothetical protein R3D55_00225 [Chloroflexota bacterium]
MMRLLPFPITDIEIHPNQRTFVSIDAESGIYVWDFVTGEIIRRLPTTGILVEINPNGQTALSASTDGSIIKWQLAEPSPEELIPWLQEKQALARVELFREETYRILPLCDEGNCASNHG